MGDVYKPRKSEVGWIVEVSHYPESRTVDLFSFETKEEAEEFYNDQNA